jgi:hypothetical protein
MFDTRQQQARRRKLLVRSVVFALMVLLSFVTPVWVPLILAATALLYFGAYELVLIGFLLDALYAPSTFAQPFGDFIFTAVMLILASARWFATHHMTVRH